MLAEGLWWRAAPCSRAAWALGSGGCLSHETNKYRTVGVFIIVAKRFEPTQPCTCEGRGSRGRCVGAREEGADVAEHWPGGATPAAVGTH